MGDGGRGGLGGGGGGDGFGGGGDGRGGGRGGGCGGGGRAQNPPGFLIQPGLQVMQYGCLVTELKPQARQQFTFVQKQSQWVGWQ